MMGLASLAGHIIQPRQKQASDPWYEGHGGVRHAPGLPSHSVVHGAPWSVDKLLEQPWQLDDLAPGSTHPDPHCQRLPQRCASSSLEFHFTPCVATFKEWAPNSEATSDLSRMRGPLHCDPDASQLRRAGHRRILPIQVVTHRFASGANLAPPHWHQVSSEVAA